MLIDENRNKRFFICYKKQIKDTLKKEITIITAPNYREALIKCSNTKKIINQKIERDEKREGWIYCEEVYNPRESKELINGV